MRMIAYSCFVIGIVSLIYLIAIISYAGPNTAFLWFWSGLFVISFISGGVFYYLNKSNIIIPKAIAASALVLFLIGLLLFSTLLGIIIINGRSIPKDDSDYVIVLGAQVRGRALSRALKNRLDTAYGYLEKNEDTKVIVSGGQGPGEEITEAQAMSDYLLTKGIDRSRIIMEDKSTNTYENLKFSKEFIKDPGSEVVIVSNDFHVFRSLGIAKKLGYTKVSGLGAPSDDILIISYYVREFMAVLKDKLLGNI